MHDSPANQSLESEISRREFVASTLSAGFVLASSSLSAQSIRTDAEGILAGDIGIPAADGKTPAYHALPLSGQSLPIVLVVCEIFGLQEQIKDICRRFSKEGYLAVAVEHFYRHGDVSKYGMDNFEEVIKIVSQTPDTEVMSDLDAAVAWAAKNRGDGRKVGVTGFCWGGRITWLYAAHNPIDLVPLLKAPVLGLYGGKDQGIPLDTVERMREALKKAGNPSEIIVYPEAEHGFFADTRPSYRKDDAEDGWKRLLAWFKKYGVS
jgi:carboxymethylenebutenolidase